MIRVVAAAAQMTRLPANRKPAELQDAQTINLHHHAPPFFPIMIALREHHPKPPIQRAVLIAREIAMTLESVVANVISQTGKQLGSRGAYPSPLIQEKVDGPIHRRTIIMLI
jgi:hypothetical protein